MRRAVSRATDDRRGNSSSRASAARPVVLVGRGKVGHAFAWALTACGLPHVLLRSSHRRRIASAALVVLAVPDAAIPSVAEALAPHLPAGVPVAHCAGARSWRELSVLRARGHAVCQMHPLLSLAGHPITFQGGVLGLDGDAIAVRAATALARSLDMGVFSLAGVDLVQYHAAAALLANGTVALARAFQEVTTAAGLPPSLAAPLSASLLRSVSENLEFIGLPSALTGPVRRGDAPAVEAHLSRLAGLPRAAAAYRALLPLQLEIAKAIGEASPASRRRISALSTVTSKALKAPKKSRE